MAGFLQRGLLLYLFLALAISFAAPSVIYSGNTPAQNSILGWFNLQYDQGTQSVTSVGSSFNPGNSDVGTSTFNNVTNPGASGSILGFVDPLYQVFSWVVAIFKTIFSPIILLSSPGINMPTPILLIFAIPLTLLLILGLITFIRSGFA